MGLLFAHISNGVEWLNLVTSMGLVHNCVDFGIISPGQSPLKTIG